MRYAYKTSPAVQGTFPARRVSTSKRDSTSRLPAHTESTCLSSGIVHATGKQDRRTGGVYALT